MAERRISYAADVENGQSAPRISTDINNDNTTTLDEYTALNRYISTARDRRRGSASSAAGGEETQKAKKPWYKFGGSGGAAVDEQFVAPDDWVDTDIRAGLKGTDIETRRRKTGYNELVTEKTNLFVQFIGYFRGPILYGKLYAKLKKPCMVGAKTNRLDSYGIGCLVGRWSP
jgi:H+-transporting ATPase